MKISVNIKMEESLRDRSKELFAQMGLDMTAAVNMFLLAVVREKKIPFTISAVSERDESERYEKLFVQRLNEAKKWEGAEAAFGYGERAQEAEERRGFGGNIHDHHE